MRRLTIPLLIGVLWLVGCGEQKITTPTDTTPPTIIGTNVQGGPIPVDTPIVLVFSEKVDYTSAQRGISVRSSIDAEPVKGVITLQKNGHEAKFTPTERMTSGGYVLTAIGIEDTSGNVLLTPVSIFFGAVEVDTTQPVADIVPPTVVSSIPAEGQSVKTADSLTVRFNESIDAASAQAGIVVSGVEGTVKVSGAVAIFKPQGPMPAGRHTLVVVGIRDLAGNVQESSLTVPFEVIVPLPPVELPTQGGGGFVHRMEYTFERPNELDDFQVFNDGARVEKGEWVIQDEALHQLTDNVKEGNGPSGQDPAAGGYLLLTVPGSLEWRDYTVSADFVWTDDDWWGIMFYYTDELNYYRFRVEQRDSVEKNQDARIALEKFVDGTYTALVDVTEVAGLRIPDASPGKDNDQKPTNLKVSVSNGNIEIFINGKRIQQIRDTSLQKGSVAFYMTTSTGWIDNFRLGGGNIMSVEVQGRRAVRWADLKGL